MTPEHLRNLSWHKSSYSASNANCVEIATAGPDIAVRDSKDPNGPVLLFAAEEWQAFVAGITTGELDLS